MEFKFSQNTKNLLSLILTLYAVYTLFVVLAHLLIPEFLEYWSVLWVPIYLPIDLIFYLIYNPGALLGFLLIIVAIVMAPKMRQMFLKN